MWITTQDVLDWLSLDETGPVLDACIAVAESLVPTWRLASAPTDWATAKATHAHVYWAAVNLAALYYQSNVTPEGFAGFDDAGGLVQPAQSKIVQIRQMARANTPGVG